MIIKVHTQEWVAFVFAKYIFKPITPIRLSTLLVTGKSSSGDSGRASRRLGSWVRLTVCSLALQMPVKGRARDPTEHYWSHIGMSNCSYFIDNYTKKTNRQ